MPSPELEASYRAISERVVAASRGRSVCLLAVSKGQDVGKIEALYRLGHRDFGENYVQELVEKARQLEARGCAGIRWHFIGHLQTNKVRQVIPVLHAVHSIDSLKLARELAKRWKESGRAGRLPVFVQVNVDLEDTKEGLPAPEAVNLAREISIQAPELSIEGLMCIPAPSEGNPEHSRDAFRRLRDLEAACRPVTHGGLSMGMSEDFEVALAEGATHVRVGSALFGPRSYPPKG